MSQDQMRLMEHFLQIMKQLLHKSDAGGYILPIS